MKCDYCSSRAEFKIEYDVHHEEWGGLVHSCDDHFRKAGVELREDADSITEMRVFYLSGKGRPSLDRDKTSELVEIVESKS